MQLSTRNKNAKSIDLNIPLHAENAKDEIAKIYKIFLWNLMMKMNEILTTITSSNDDFTWKCLQKQSCFIQIFIRNIREIIF